MTNEKKLILIEAKEGFGLEKLSELIYYEKYFKTLNITTKLMKTIIKDVIKEMRKEGRIVDDYEVEIIIAKAIEKIKEKMK